MNKHTQSKWIADADKYNIYATFSEGTEIEHKIRIARIDGASDEQRANAELMAAAPLLYNAAYNALQAIYAMPKGKQGFYQYLINDLRDAIQKADGITTE